MHTYMVIHIFVCTHTDKSKQLLCCNNFGNKLANLANMQVLETYLQLLVYSLSNLLLSQVLK